jgi:hypothetical protein
MTTPVIVKKPQRIEAREITFWCKFATKESPEGHEVTELCFPGPTPQICSEHKDDHRRAEDNRRKREKRQAAKGTNQD